MTEKKYEPRENYPYIDSRKLTKGMVAPAYVNGAMTVFTKDAERIHVDFEFNLHTRTDGSIRFRYLFEGEDVNFGVRLVKNLRIWRFVCPLKAINRPCARTCVRLYLAHTPYFGCEYCQKLTWWSRQRYYGTKYKNGPYIKKLLELATTPRKRFEAMDLYLRHVRYLEKQVKRASRRSPLPSDQPQVPPAPGR